MEYHVVTQRPVPYQMDVSASGAKLIVLIDQLLQRKGVYSNPQHVAQGMQSLFEFSGSSPRQRVVGEIQEFEHNVEGLDDSLNWFCASQGLLALRSLSSYLEQNPSLGNFEEVQEWIQATLSKLEICAKLGVKWHLEISAPEGAYFDSDSGMIKTSVPVGSDYPHPTPQLA